MEQRRVEAAASAGTSLWQWAGHEAIRVAESASSASGGVVINHADRVADIYLVRGSEAIGRLIQDSVGGHGRIKWVDRSYAELVAVRDRIVTEYSWFASVGLRPTSWGPDPATNGVIVNVPAFSQEQAVQVRNRFGQFVRLVSNPENPQLLAGRWADSQPWVGGDTILRAPGGLNTCTLGPAIRNTQSGNVYSLVPAHCGLSGTTWYNGVPYSAVPNSRYVGHVAYRDGNLNGGTDSAIIYSNAAPSDWRYGTTSALQRAAITTADRDQGVCVSGSLSGEMCGTTIVAVNFCWSFGSRITCNLSAAQLDGQAVAGSGDSGAPVYSVRFDGGLDVRGMLVGGDGISGLHEVPCLYWVNPNRKCFDKVFFVAIGALLAQWSPTALYTS